jgi:rhamnose utilization protein RhaD (predicted bifunctional aldolase and dehydrogenase)/NAD(P)-dependent dehydrogenase (short-subunit alcohol dehydrogenase family)
MQSRWSEEDAAGFVAQYGARWGEDLALRTYASRLLGSEPSLVLHGGGNTSLKGSWTNVLGESVAALFVKASGGNMAFIEPEGHPALDLAYLRRLRGLSNLDDETMVNELRAHLFLSDSPTPSIETLVHAFLPARFVDHTHADAILALTNQVDGDRLVREALGSGVAVLPYVTPGFRLALAAARAIEERPSLRAMVWAHHGIVTWGDTARSSYETMIDLVSKAERYLDERTQDRPAVSVDETPMSVALERATWVAPLVRGLLAARTGDPDNPYRRVIVQGLVTPDVLALVDSGNGHELALTPPLTTDHLIRTKALPAWVDRPAYDQPEALREQLTAAVREYSAAYDAYIERHRASMPPGMRQFDPLPRVVLMPGLGAWCAGRDVIESSVVRDITAHTLAVKAQVARMGAYRGLSESELFRMEYRTLQHAKLPGAPLPLGGRVALVTGAAGAIGAGICQGLLEQGCHVAVTDLPGGPLDSLVEELTPAFGPRVMGVPLDVTDAGSVARAFEEIGRAWGGIDLVVANAGIAMVAALADLDLEEFRRLERVNVEGTLLLLSESARHFRQQATGGDIVLVSTKNVFAPGAKFGAYSATKAASHQLARIASLELAGLDVRVNMVSPDAVFAHGARRSGLWAEVGPDRMRARGLDEAGLEAYYRDRNLLKARVTAGHVARAVLFFATRQTPTTGSTIPVDGGLPDATPR